MILSSLQVFFFRETNFNFCQFYSNFFKYLFLNFLSSYLYSIFAIYFSSISSLLKSLFSIISNSFHLLTSVFNLPSNSVTVMECLGPNILFFFYPFFFWFYFSFRTMKKACDKEVTWQVTWCDAISLELNGRVGKMTLGHLEYIWGPWVEHETGMRIKHGHKSRVIY